MPFSPINLNDGHAVPSIAFGTAGNIPLPSATAYIAQALAAGFTHIDTAQNYGSEADVGRAIKLSGVQRDKLYITTKWSYGPYGKGVRESCEESLAKMGLEYVDMYLIHDPEWVKGDVGKVWKEMERLVEDGKARSIGVSNYEIHHLEELLPHCTIKPAVNQIEFHPCNYQAHRALLAYMKRHEIALEAFRILTPLTRQAGGPVEETVDTIAHRMGKQPEQVLLAWARIKGAILITTSTRKCRLGSYLDSADIKLSLRDVQAIDEAGDQSTWSARCGMMAPLIFERRRELATIAFLLLCVALWHVGVPPRQW